MPGLGLGGGPVGKDVRCRFLPELLDMICTRAIDPGRVFDLTLPLDQAAEGYRAMGRRLRPPACTVSLPRRG